MSGEKTCGLSTELPLADIKAFCKRNKCTVNDYCSALLGSSLYKYFGEEKERMIKENHKEPIDIPRAVHIAIPFSLRQPFKKVSDVRLSNNFGSILVKF